MIIDDYAYFQNAYPQLFALIQKHIEDKWKHGELTLILSGFKGKRQTYMNGLTGCTSRIEILPFQYNELKQLHWQFTENELAQIYGITSGVGKYLNMIDPQKSVRENIIMLYLTPNTMMYEETSNFLNREVHTPRMYHSVLVTISKGYHTVTEIAKDVKENTCTCDYYLKVLVELGVVEKLILNGQLHTTAYHIRNSAFLFWYRFLFPFITEISLGNSELIYDRYIELNLDDFMEKLN